MATRSSKTETFALGKVIDTPMHSAVRTRFLNYAVSVITSRALPDVRDGLKPVQRRILYTMYEQLHLTPEKSTLKCAKIVGQVLGDFHPHGDSSVYEAMVRLAQPWSLRYPLVYGQGNFGSIDGDGPAAYRYTEAKLQPMAMEFVAELGQDTVDYRSNFDERLLEPVVLPTKVPQLLINGCMGIAVGMATNIPPHNIGEVMRACEALIDNPQISDEELFDCVPGPDFPTGGMVLDDRRGLAKIYREGQGPIRVRGTYTVEESGRKRRSVVIDSIPYMVNKAKLVESLGDIIVSGKLPQLLDVRDESTDDVRIVLECQADSDVEAIMAYLFKHTDLQTTFHVNMTCLTSEGPRCVGLRRILQEFVAFRREVTERRLNYEVRQLTKRIHILEGFVKVFDALDEAIEIIRAADGRKQAGERLRERFELDEEQANAILELRLYCLGRTDILQVRTELEDKLAERSKRESILASEKDLWKFVRREMLESHRKMQDERRTKIALEGVSEFVYQETDFIVEEPAQVILTKDGWVRRTTMGVDLSKLRLRQDDAISTILPTTNLSSVLFFTDMGAVYTMRVNDLPISRSSGYGDPVQKFFKFSDGEKVVAVFTFDSRDTLGIALQEGQEVPLMHGVAVASDGKGFRFSFEGFVEPSTSKGRRFAKLADGGRIVSVQAIRGRETAVVVSKGGHALLFPVSEISYLSGVGRGVTLIKLEDGDSVLDFVAVTENNCGISVVREEGGKVFEVTPKNYKTATRGGKGIALSKRGRLRVEERYLNTANSTLPGGISGIEDSKV